MSLGNWLFKTPFSQEKQLRYFRKATSLDSSKASYFFDLGLLYYNHKQDYDSTIIAMRQAIKLFDWSVYCNYISLAYEKMGENQKAIDTFTEALKTHPNDGMVYQNRAFLYKRLGMMDKYRADIAMRDKLR